MTAKMGMKLIDYAFRSLSLGPYALPSREGMPYALLTA